MTLWGRAVLLHLQEEKAIAEGVRVRDAWDGSIQDIELEVTGFHRQEFTAEEERQAVESAVRKQQQQHAA